MSKPKPSASNRFSLFVSRVLAVATLPLVFAPAATFAETYPLRANTEIIMIPDARVHLEVKNILLRQARQSIDNMTFSQLSDDVGNSVVGAIRNAQVGRQIRYRGIYEWLASFFEGGKKISKAGRVLADPALACPGEVVCGHPLDKFSAGLSITDYTHGKYCGIDVGTADEIVFLGGRNDSNHMLHTLDMGYVIRPIDPSKPYLGTDLAKNFDELIAVLQGISSKSTMKMPFVAPDAEDIPSTRARRFVSTEREKAEIKEILDVLRKRPSADDALKPWQFRPKAVQLRTNDLFKQLTSDAYKTRLFPRYDLPNENHSHLAEEIRRFKGGTIQLSSYSYAPTADVHEALIDFINEGGQLHVYTNGLSGHRNLMFKGDRATSAYYTLETLIDLYDRTVGAKGALHVHLLNADRAKAAGLPWFLHRKVVNFISKDRRFIETGSDNYTWSSAKKNDEHLIMIEDDRLSTSLEEQTRSEQHLYDTVEEAEIRSQFAKRPFLYRCLRTLIKKIF
jgi:phosphatidylserine/phosphatidylglycerophosphate/cardiolipin synthase-like enzyme